MRDRNKRFCALQWRQMYCVEIRYSLICQFCSFLLPLCSVMNPDCFALRFVISCLIYCINCTETENIQTVFWRVHWEWNQSNSSRSHLGSDIPKEHLIQLFFLVFSFFLLYPIHYSLRFWKRKIRTEGSACRCTWWPINNVNSIPHGD